MQWEIDGVNGDPMEDFGITPPRGERREAASRSRRYREEVDVPNVAGQMPFLYCHRSTSHPSKLFALANLACFDATLEMR